MQNPLPCFASAHFKLVLSSVQTVCRGSRSPTKKYSNFTLQNVYNSPETDNNYRWTTTFGFVATLTTAFNSVLSCVGSVLLTVYFADAAAAAAEEHRLIMLCAFDSVIIIWPTCDQSGIIERGKLVELWLNLWMWCHSARTIQQLENSLPWWWWWWYCACEFNVSSAHNTHGLF